MSIFYGHNKNQTAQEAVSVGYVAPSITPFLDLNPGFRVYKIDSTTFEVVDAITYIADLDQAESWVDGPVNMHKKPTKTIISHLILELAYRVFCKRGI